MASALGRKHWCNMARKRKSLRLKLMVRDEGKCRYCAVKVELPKPGYNGQLPDNAATIEHYPAPRRCLRPDQWFDLHRVMLACYRCNQQQELQGGLRPIVEPPRVE